MGESYDPAFLAGTRVPGNRGDAATAAQWYLRVRRQGFRDNGLGKLREALAHRIGEVRRPAAGAASGG